MWLWQLRWARPLRGGPLNGSQGPLPSQQTREQVVVSRMSATLVERHAHQGSPGWRLRYRPECFRTTGGTPPKHDLPVQGPQDAEVHRVGRPTVQDLAVVVLPHIAVQVRGREFRQVAACHRPRFDSQHHVVCPKILDRQSTTREPPA